MIQKVRPSTFSPVFPTGLIVSSGLVNLAAGATLKTVAKSDLGGGAVTSNGPAFATPVSVAFAAGLVVDCNLGSPIEVSQLTGNITSLNLLNFQLGQIVQFILKQDSVGSRTVATPLGYKISGTINLLANSYSALTFYKPKDPTFAVLGFWNSFPA